jgi:hypothetical protein
MRMRGRSWASRLFRFDPRYHVGFEPKSSFRLYLDVLWVLIQGQPSARGEELEHTLNIFAQYVVSSSSLRVSRWMLIILCS